MPKILIVDDDKTLRKIYKSYLTSEGFDVLEATTGEEALLGFPDQNFDIILLDIRMPRVSGWFLMSALSTYYPESKIIVFSCYPLHVQNEMVPDAVSYYDKSTGFKKLLSEIKKNLQLQSNNIL
jgi:CheY-like chemotaxis protein